MMPRLTVARLVIPLITLTYIPADAQDPTEIASNTPSRKPAELKKASELKATVVTPVLDWPIEEGKNVIWCSTFQLAWNELRDGMVGEDVLLNGGPEWVSILNKKPATKDDLSGDSYVALVGWATDNIVARINEALQRVKFQLNERGATLSSTARLKVKSRGDGARFIFDNPFLIILRQTGSQRPYFAAWIGNAELLQKM